MRWRCDFFRCLYACGRVYGCVRELGDRRDCWLRAERVLRVKRVQENSQVPLGEIQRPRLKECLDAEEGKGHSPVYWRVRTE